MRGYLSALVFAGCSYYQAAPGTYVKKPVSSFDRSWAAAIGALRDQGV